MILLAIFTDAHNTCRNSLLYLKLKVQNGFWQVYERFNLDSVLYLDDVNI